jgi:hypothetical protein
VADKQEKNFESGGSGITEESGEMHFLSQLSSAPLLSSAFIRFFL